VSGHVILLGQAKHGACDGGRHVEEKKIKASRTLTGNISENMQDRDQDGKITLGVGKVTV
jgi:hypothetical protein